MQREQVERSIDGPWTRFMDMHSGGGQKLSWSYIYIQAPKAEARAVFFAKFGRNPDRVTCTCCGEDYSYDESDGLRRASGFDRGCRVLETPRGPDGRYVAPARGTPEGDYFHASYYLEPGEEPRFGFSVSTRMAFLSRRREALCIEVWVQDPPTGTLLVWADEIAEHERRVEVPPEGFEWAGGDS